MPELKRAAVPLALTAVWIVAAALGLRAFADYNLKSTAALTQGSMPPAGVALFSSKDKDTWSIVVAAHPKCPCTRATVNELGRLLARAHSKVKVEFLFYRPEGSGLTWNKTDLWKSACEIPGTVVIDDPNGSLAARLGATVSGETFVYSPDGKLCFHGGITGWRGHEGDNAGEDSVIALLNGSKARESDTPVFGCSLQ